MVPGLVHRYYDRVLMVLTDICPMLCRHCTRKREWVNGGWVRTPAEVQAMLDYIRQHKEVRDVIISGGDPLTLSNRRLEETIAGIRRISHVEIIRIGTRFPVVLPQRIDADLCNMLSQYGPIWLNTHFNHYREITPESAAAVDRLLRAGDGGVHQHAVASELHGNRGIRGGADTRIYNDRNFDAIHDQLKIPRVEDAHAGADQRCQWHDRHATNVFQLFRDNRVVRGIDHHLKAFCDQRLRGGERFHHIGVERLRIAQDFELYQTVAIQ